MPSHVPRTDTTKKRQQLERREQELEHALQGVVSRERLVRAAEAVRAAQLSLLKAELHWAEDARIQGQEVGARIENIQRRTRLWTSLPVDEILSNYEADPDN